MGGELLIWQGSVKLHEGTEPWQRFFCRGNGVKRGRKERGTVACKYKRGVRGEGENPHTHTHTRKEKARSAAD